MNKSIHYNWIDWAKAFGIFLVIWGHSWMIPDSLKSWIYSFHMPLFFILSGVLYKPLTVVDTIRKDWNRLLIPYILYNLTLLLFYSLLHVYSHTFNITFLKKSFIAIILGMGYSTDWATPVCDPGWFIISLFIIHIITAATIKSKLHVLLFTIVSIIIVLIFKYFTIRSYIPIDSSFLAFPFFVFGYYCRKWLLGIQSTQFLILGVLFMGVCSLFLNRYNGYVDIDLCLYGKNIIIFYLSGISGSFALIFLCMLLFNRSNYIISVVARGTIFILGFNLFFIGISRIILEHIDIEISPILLSFIDSLLIICFSTILIALFIKLSPSFLGLKKQ